MHIRFKEHICAELIIHPLSSLELVCLRSTINLSCLGRLGFLGGSGVFPEHTHVQPPIPSKQVKQNVPEAILEPPRNLLQMLHPSSSSRLSALSLLAPLIRAQLGTRVAALGASCNTQPSALYTQQNHIDTHFCVAYGRHGSRIDGRPYGISCVVYCPTRQITFVFQTRINQSYPKEVVPSSNTLAHAKKSQSSRRTFRLEKMDQKKSSVSTSKAS